MARHFLSPCVDPLASFFVTLALVYNDERLHLGLLSRVANYCVSYSTPTGLGAFLRPSPRLHLNAIKLRYNLLIFNHFLCVLGWGTRFFTFNKNNDLRPGGRKIWHDRAFFNKNIAFIKEFLNLMALRFSLSYSYSTPTGLGASSALPQVPPVAIHIQPLRG